MKEFQPLANLLPAGGPAKFPGDRPAPDPVQQKLARSWRTRAGAAALHGRPLLFASGRLVVFVETASWGTEIRHHSQGLMEALAGDGIRVNAVEVKVLPDSPPPGRRTGRPPPRLSLQNAEQIEALAGGIEDAELKASLLRLAKRAGKE